jgi:hypothetical protein
MRTHPIKLVAAIAVAVLAVLGIVFGVVTACGSSDQDSPSPD